MIDALSSPEASFPDTLTQRIGVLNRREVEARILKPIVDALAERFDRDEVIEVVKQCIIELARDQGRDLARSRGGCGSAEFVDSLEYWKQDDALELDILVHDERRLEFNVTHCKYAEMYRALGMPELGALFSCNRDFALIEGFNEAATLERTQTIMGGASHCDFRYWFGDKDG